MTEVETTEITETPEISDTGDFERSIPPLIKSETSQNFPEARKMDIFSKVKSWKQKFIDYLFPMGMTYSNMKFMCSDCKFFVRRDYDKFWEEIEEHRKTGHTELNLFSDVVAEYGLNYTPFFVTGLIIVVTILGVIF